MTESDQSESPAIAPLRLWPGVAIVAIQWFGRYAIPAVFPGATSIRAMAALGGGLAILLWWAVFSRAHARARWGGVLLLLLAPVLALSFLHESLSAGVNVMQFALYATPVICLAFVASVAVSRRLADPTRSLVSVAMVLLACGAWGLVRIAGIDGDRVARFEWRWAASHEDRLVGQAPAPGTSQTLADANSIASSSAEAAWPGLRGPGRDGVVEDVLIGTDWTAAPPAERWRRPVGPGWSSFAISGERLYSQEQRGDDELVSCYSALTGEPIWTHRDPVRFSELRTGAGPRATPALSDGRVFALGATGILNVLDAGDGSSIWSRDIATEVGVEVPMWGFSGSPLVTRGVVIVAAAGILKAYAVDSGELRWTGPDRGGSWGSYSSPHLMTLDGVEQVLLLSGAGVTSVDPIDGAVLWEDPWPGFGQVQPVQTPDGDLLLGAKDTGTHRIQVSRQAGDWSVEERWESNRLKPYFNDFVVHDGHAYGFDGGILACIDLAEGRKQWKGGRYGHGQMLLLPEQDLLLVISEKGTLALVSATPEAFAELAALPIFTSKTWNHPALVGNHLYLRNDQEMVALRLPPPN